MYLGIDIGTSGVKTVLIEAGQRVIASASAPLDVLRPRSGWSEQDPDAWWAATQATLDELKTRYGREMAAVEGIGLSGQMHGATVLDTSDRPLRPAILWNDGRSAAECAILDERADFRGIGGNLVMPGFTAPKLEWLRRHESETFKKISKVLLPKDYVRLKLIGDYVSDMSDSAGTLWLDVAGRRWSETLLSATELTVSHMPRLVEGSEASGTVRPELASRWGFARPPVVAGGGGDNAASACGIGAVAPGTAFLSLGTSGVLFVATDRFRPNTARAVHAFCHALPQSWHQMGVILSATDSLNWLARMTGSEPAALVADAESTRPDEAGVLFLPYLSGERTPHNDAGARGVFTGLSQNTTRADLAQAVLTGVAFAFRDCLEALMAAGTTVERMTAVGGGARSRHWLQILATVLDRPVDLPAHGETGAAFGAARLGLLAAAGGDPAAVCSSPAVECEILPEPGRRGWYDDQFARYRALYPAVKEALS